MFNEVLRILLIEDNPADVRLILNELRKSGWTPDVIQAQTEVEFLLNLNLAPDIILCDYNLPQFDALRALELLRERNLHVPFFVVSGSIGEEVAVEAIKHGASDYLLKDRLSRLGPAIQQALSQQELRRAEREAHEALRESERFARATVDALSANIAILDETGVILRVNRAWSDFAKDNSSRMIAVNAGANYLRVCDEATGIGQEMAHAFAAGIRSVMRGFREEFVLEYSCHSPTEQRWFVGRVTRFPGSGPLRVVVAHENITQRKQIEEALRESRTLLEQAQRIAGLGTWASGLSASDSLWWSDQTYKIFGQSHGQFDGQVKSFFEAVHPDDRAAVAEASRAALAGEQPYEIEHRILRPDGTIRWVHQLAEVIRDQNGQVLQLIGVVRDITERREREDALRASQAMLALVLDTIPLGVFWKDRNSVYLGANRVSRQATGFDTLESLIGKTDFEFSAITREQAEFFVRKDREVMESNRPEFGIEETLTLPDGSTIWLDTNKVPMRDSAGQVIGILGTWQDITERKRVDDELRASRERLQVLSRQLMNAQEDERRHIARELHDEIGQALTGIKLNLNALQQSIQSEADKAIWQDTLAITNRTLEQIRNLSLNLRPSMLDDLGLAAALRWLLDRQAQRAGFSSQFVAESLETGVSKDVETVCFRVVQECLTNIARHAQAQQVRVELRRSESNLELTVIDDGVGFDVLAARERATHGSSLGLLGMQERVLFLGGQLEIESVPSRGTQTRVRFPLASTAPQERTE